MIFEPFLNFYDYIIAICRSTYVNNRNFLLSYNACFTIIHDLISGRLDYCNSILYNVPTNTTDILKRL